MMEHKRHPLATVLRCVAALLAGLFGVVLLVAGKTGAGIALAVAAVLLPLPLQRLAGKMAFLKWLRLAVVLVLCVSAVINIANTDIPPDAEITGIKFLDQLSAIFKRFVDTVTGNRR